MAATILARADLLRVLLAAPEAERTAVARLMGYEAAPVSPAPLRLIIDPSESRHLPKPDPPPEIADVPLSPATFWQPFRFAKRPPLVVDSVSGSTIWRSRPTELPVFNVLAPWRELEPRLRRLLGASVPGAAIDADLAVEVLSRARPLLPVPRRTRPDWARRIDIVVDRSDRLIPFWQDQDVLLAALKARIQGPDIRVASFDESRDEPWFTDGPYASPVGGGVVLVLGDLGCLDAAPRRPIGQWQRFAARLWAEGCRPTALLTAPLSRCPPNLRRVWHIEPWETPGADLPQDEISRQVRAERLLGFLTGSVRIEPGLLRAIRRAIPAAAADVGTEADVWQHKALRSRHPRAATPDKTVCDAIVPPDPSSAAWADAWRSVVARRHEWRFGCRDEVWFLEVLGLPEAARAVLPWEDFENARAFFHAIHDRPAAIADQAIVEAFLDEAALRAGARAWNVAEFEQAVGARAAKVNPSQLPDGRDPRGLGPALGPEGVLKLYQRGGGVLADLDEEAPPDVGSLLGMLRSGHQVAQLVPVAHPPWADGGGEDQYGIWASFDAVCNDGARVVQRMRWIPPGRFMMGSPESEKGRFSDEGPVHEVIIDSGFWMFETACTEALWVAVTGRAPERARGPRFPVTGVSWDDAQDFVRGLNALQPSLNLSLPSEARWEYACRAGTTTPYNFGTSITPDLACYHKDNPVEAGSLPPNAWGLCEMHGNVWEWCEDDYFAHQGASDGSARIGGAGAALFGANRVVRGGAWDNDARYARAACRNGYGQSRRYDYFGFRCTRLQSVSETSEAEPAAAALGLARRAGAEHGQPQGPMRDAALLRVGVPGLVTLPKVSRIVIRSDREELHFRRLSKPNWASAIGRDCYGLFTEITIPDTEISQRLRWIPPGRFWMGSPEDEVGGLENEGPRHEVTLQRGFWLFDTPCTQRLWEAVMGGNPSRFVDPTRPVEQVSFDDAQQFLALINERVSKLDLVLPSEAQWEYACRAGTETALYAGAMSTVGENNAPMLDAISWYSGNSGVDFELENGEDSSGWLEKQYDHAKAGTRPVGLKVANPWGLHDMLGNVWEWCADTWHDSYDGAPTNGSARTKTGGAADRVVRGGSWRNVAQGLRAACRLGNGPTDRDDGLGFRCARVHGASAVSGAERRVGRGKPGERSDPAAPTNPKRRLARTAPSRRPKRT